MMAVLMRTVLTSAVFKVKGPAKRGRSRMILTLLTVTAMLLQGCAMSGTSSGLSSEGARQPPVSADGLLTVVQQADAAYKAAQWPEATTKYQELLTVLPDDPFAWFRLGNALTQQGLYSQAILAYEKSLTKDAVQAKPWFNLSTAHLLGAQLATMRAWQSAGISEPTREVAKRRLDGLAVLLR